MVTRPRPRVPGYELSIAFSDEGNDGSVNFFIDWGDGSPVEPFTPVSQISPATISHIFVDNVSGASTTISVVTEDDKATYVAATKDITVANVAPELLNLAAASELGLGLAVVEGDSVALTGDVVDPGVLDSFTLSVDWGDGSDPEDFPLAARSLDFNVVHRYAQDGTYTINATLIDDDDESDTQSTTVTVANAAPVVRFDLDSTEVDEAAPLTLSGTISDVGLLDLHSVSVDWGDNNSEDVTVDGRTFSATHIYEDDDPTATIADSYVITVTVADLADGTSTDIDTQTVDVVDVAPTTLTVDTDASTIATSKAIGETVTLTATFTDPVGTNDTYDALITWDDGNTSMASGSFDANTGIGTVTATHNYGAEGIYEVNIEISDDDTGTSSTESTLALIGNFTNSTPNVDDQMFSVAENSPVDTVVGTIAASDDGALTYELTSLPTLLALTATSNGPADGQWDQDIALTFTLNDGTTSPTSTETIELLLADADRLDNTTLDDLVNDLNSKFAAVGLDSSLLATTETDVNGNSIGERLSIGALDSSVVRLEITGGEAFGFEATQNASIPNTVEPHEFTVDPTTGQITVAADVLNAEGTSSYTLQATVTDFWGEADTSTITIDISDVNEFAPVLTLPNYFYEIAEGSPNGTIIDTVAASDFDLGDEISFSLVPITPFAIDSTSGVITVSDRAVLDFDTNPGFELDVIATDLGGLTDTQRIYINLTEVEGIPSSLNVTAVKVGSSVWGTDFLQAVDPDDGIGYAIPFGDNQLNPLPWGNIRQIFVEFSEDVGSVGLDDIGLYGVNNLNYEDRIGSVAYDPIAHRATIDIARVLGGENALPLDNFILVVRDSITNLDDVQLDGEWIDGSSTTSGNGFAGGDFEFRFDILPGDTNQSGTVAVNDIGSVRMGLGKSMDDSDYSIFADHNGSGAISVDDLVYLRDNLGYGSPAEAPVVVNVAVSAVPMLGESADRARVKMIDQIMGAISYDDEILQPQSAESLDELVDHRAKRERLRVQSHRSSQ